MADNPKIADIVRGDTRDMPLTLDVNGIPVDLTGSKIYFTMKKRLDQSDEQSELQVVKTVHDDPTAGKTTISLSALQTSLLEPGRYYYDFQIVHTDGRVKTIGSNTVNVVPDVTRSTS